MRVVIVHNRYRSANPSGENRVVESDIEQLRADGVEVIPYIRDSDEIEQFTPVGKASLGFTPVMNPAVALEFRRLLRDVQPHIVHLHNPFPLISPWIVRTAKAQRIPVVQTVHNYRHVCVNGIHFRDGTACFECVGKSVPWPAVKHGCYQESRARSIPMAASLVAHRKTWDLVDRFLPVGDSVADHLRAIGIDERQIEVRPNVMDDPGPPKPLGVGALFVGRLSREKGVEVLIEAWRKAGLSDRHTLSIAGDGELRSVVEQAANRDPSINYLGLLGREELRDAYERCAIVLVPSLWPEPDPVALISALAHGRPVIGTALGSIPSSLEDGAGWIAEPAASSLSSALLTALNNRPDCERRGRQARQRYESTRDPARGIRLTNVYERLTKVPRGSLVVVGPDGAGKTSVLDEIADRARAAEVRIERRHFRPGIVVKASGDGLPVTDPHGQPPRTAAVGVARSLVVWSDFLAGWLGPWARSGRRGLLLLERPWLDQAVDPTRYRLPRSTTGIVTVLGRLLPRADAGVLLTGDPNEINRRKPEVGLKEVERQLSAWRRLLPGAARRSAEIRSVGVPLEHTADGVIRSTFAPQELRTMTWVKPLGFPPRISMHATTAPIPRSALKIYPPQRRSAAFSSKLGSAALRLGIATPAPRPAPPIDLICSTVGLPFDALCAMRSSAPGRWVIGAELAGRLRWVIKAGPESDRGLANEAHYLALLGEAPTRWGVPRLVCDETVGGWRVLCTEAVQSRGARPTLDDAVTIANDLVAGIAAGQPIVHGDLAPWNLIRESDGRVVVLDWEEADAGYAPFWDLAHFVIQQGILLGSPTPEEVVGLLTAPCSVGRGHLPTSITSDEATTAVVQYLDQSPPPDHPNALQYRDQLRALLT